MIMMEIEMIDYSDGSNYKYDNGGEGDDNFHNDNDIIATMKLDSDDFICWYTVTTIDDDINSYDDDDTDDNDDDDDVDDI